MAIISRLRATQIQNGQLINADDLSAEFDQLVNNDNAQETRLVAVESSTITGGTNWLGTKTGATITHTLASTPPSYPDGMSLAFEVGATIAKDTAVTLNLDGQGVWPIYTIGAQPARGADLAKGAIITVKKKGSAWLIDTPTRLPSLFIQAPVPSWTSTTSITVDGAAVMRDQSNTADIVLTDVARAINLSAGNSLNGRAEATAIANQSAYHLYGVMRDNFSASGWVLSLDAAATSFTLGGDLYSHVRRVPLSVMTDTSGNILPFNVDDWSATYANISYSIDFPNTLAGLGTGDTNFVNALGAVTYANQVFAAYVPAIATHAAFYATSSASTRFRLKSYNNQKAVGFSQIGLGGVLTDYFPIDSDRDIQVENDGFAGSGTLYLDVYGYRIAV